MRYSTTNVTAEDDKARVQVEETLDGPEKEIAAVGLIPLPEGADGSDVVGVSLGPVGGASTVLGDAVYLASPKALEMYETIAKGTGSPRVLTFSGRPAILIPRVLLKGKQQISVSFRAPVRVPRVSARWRARCPPPHGRGARWSASPST